MAVLADLGGTVESINPATAAWIDFWPCHPIQQLAPRIIPFLLVRKKKKWRNRKDDIVDVFPYSFSLFWVGPWVGLAKVRAPSKCLMGCWRQIRKIWQSEKRYIQYTARPFWIYYYTCCLSFIFSNFPLFCCVVCTVHTHDDDRHVYLFFIFIIPMAVAFELGATRQVLRHFLGPALHSAWIFHAGLFMYILIFTGKHTDRQTDRQTEKANALGWISHRKQKDERRI